MPPSPLRPSACPSLLRIVHARDGGICRVKLAGGVLPAQQAEALADAAQRYSGGVLEATNRANLQVRGIGAEAPALQQALLAAGLGSAHPAGDDVRNLMLSPLAGRCPAQALDVRPLAAQLLRVLEGEPRYHGLSAKFAVQLDGGEALACLDHPHDLWLTPLWWEGQWQFGLGLASSVAGGQCVAVLAPAQALAGLLAVLERFLALAGTEQSRMRQLLGAVGLEAFMAPLGLRRIAQPVPPRPTAAALGIHPQAEPGRVAVGAQFVLGRFRASQLQALAGLARRLGSGVLHFTPWQGLLLPDVAAPQAGEAQAALRELGLLTDPQAPLAALVACSGSEGCAKAQADTKADAHHLATLLAPARAVHLSGCPRACAGAHGAPYTLLAVAPGRYDLFIRDAAHAGLGRLRARELTLQAAATLLNGLPRSDTR
ncbi:precorrin-3B synthase [Pseudomonas sp. NPDC007930]|uniref:precorrin-3B synthase n=1 Tax=Pseudomonas sp. NPDC007930 TaxID=3364417 RepID=UPI0036EAAB83